MSWNPALIPIRDLLANLYPREEDARRIIADAELPVLKISFGSNSQQTWHSIIVQAKSRTQLPKLVETCLADSESVELRSLFEDYTKALNDIPIPAKIDNPITNPVVLRDYNWEVFISYSRSDEIKYWVRRYFFPKLKTWLAEELGQRDVRIFIDEAEICLGSA